MTTPTTIPPGDHWLILQDADGNRGLFQARPKSELLDPIGSRMEPRIEWTIPVWLMAKAKLVFDVANRRLIKSLYSMSDPRSVDLEQGLISSLDTGTIYPIVLRNANPTCTTVYSPEGFWLSFAQSTSRSDSQWAVSSVG